ncbi:FAD-dependent monooxygenase [Streptomyces sp. NPDC006879]|uniref:FAD-dependent monooxygenase n=1 Tax=Streptomyces sp. NPDC006879 TaxID=3364767 RepID=UPI0036A62715
MAADRLDTQVIVVGAGPVGLLLAGELRLGGAEVVVLEQRAAPTTESRASTLHARTMEVFDSRGLLDALGTPPQEPRGHFGGLPLDLTLPSRYPGQWKVPQFRTEELLQEWALSLGADLRRGHELLALDGATGAHGHVEAHVQGPGGAALTVRGRYLVACDGEESTVRRLTGAVFPGQSAERELLRADVDGIDIPNRRFERLEHGLAIAHRRAEDGVTRVMVHEFGTTAQPRVGQPEFPEICGIWKRVTGEDISGGTPLWVNSFGDANRQLFQYRSGRILFAGDAAHQQMPVGGQALNLGLQDAFNLGWKLALVSTGRAPEDLLDTYHQERHAIGKQVLGNIKAQALLLLGGPEVEPLRAVLSALIGHEAVRQHLAGMISGLDVRYPPDSDPAPAPVGARLPHVELTTAAGPTTTTSLLRGGRGLLLQLHGSATAGEIVAGWADRVVAVVARPEPGRGLESGSVLVRPDGHIAWARSGSIGLREALERWFGPSD